MRPKMAQIGYVLTWNRICMIFYALKTQKRSKNNNFYNIFTTCWIKPVYLGHKWFVSFSFLFQVKIDQYYFFDINESFFSSFRPQSWEILLFSDTSLSFLGMLVLNIDFEFWVDSWTLWCRGLNLLRNDSFMSKK